MSAGVQRGQFLLIPTFHGRLLIPPQDILMDPSSSSMGSILGCFVKDLLEIIPHPTPVEILDGIQSFISYNPIVWTVPKDTETLLENFMKQDLSLTHLTMLS